MRIDVGDGTRLFVDCLGGALEPTPSEMAARPSLVLLHGGPGGDHSSLRPYFDRFTDTHQVLYVDQRGQGRSDGGEQPGSWNLDQWADDVVAVCDALDVHDPVVLGLSFGGFVAQRYAARHRGHAAKLILMSTSARPLLDLSEERFGQRGGAAASAAYRRVFVDLDVSADAMADYFAVNMPLYNNVPSGFGPHRTLTHLPVFDEFTRSEWPTLDLRADVERIEAPTLVIGGRDDPMTPPECSQEIAEHLRPGLGQLKLLDSAGHGTFRDQPERTEAVLRAFLRQEPVADPADGSRD